MSIDSSGNNGHSQIEASGDSEKSTIFAKMGADAPDVALVVSHSAAGRSSTVEGSYLDGATGDATKQQCIGVVKKQRHSATLKDAILTNVGVSTAASNFPDSSVSIENHEKNVHRLATLFDLRQSVTTARGRATLSPTTNGDPTVASDNAGHLKDGEAWTSGRHSKFSSGGPFPAGKVKSKTHGKSTRSRSIDSRLSSQVTVEHRPSAMGSSSFDLTDDARLSSNFDELKLLDNKQNFSSAKALFENLERESRQQTKCGAVSSQAWTKRVQRTSLTQVDVDCISSVSSEGGVAGYSTNMEPTAERSLTERQSVSGNLCGTLPNDKISSLHNYVSGVTSADSTFISTKTSNALGVQKMARPVVSSAPPPVPPKPKLEHLKDSKPADVKPAKNKNGENSAPSSSSQIDFSSLNSVSEEFSELVNNLLKLGSDLSPQVSKTDRSRKSSSSSANEIFDVPPDVPPGLLATEEAISLVTTYSDAFSCSTTKIICNESLAIEKASFNLYGPPPSVDVLKSSVGHGNPSPPPPYPAESSTKLKDVPIKNSEQDDIIVRRLIFDTPTLSELFQSSAAHARDDYVEEQAGGTKKPSDVLLTCNVEPSHPPLDSTKEAAQIDPRQSGTITRSRLEEDRVKFRQKSTSATEEPDDAAREVKSLSCHVSVPQDVEVDFKRLSTCSIDSSVDHLALSTFDKYLVANESDIHWISDSEFYIEVAGLNANVSTDSSGGFIDLNSSIDYKPPSKVTFSNGKMRVYSTYGPADYDRRNDDIDPVSASAEYELERRLEKMETIDIEIVKGGEGLGISIIGMGVGADAGLEKLGIFIKSITPGGAVFRDGRVHVSDQIVEVDNKSLVGVSQTYAASVLRSTDGVVKFKLGREKDLDTSEIAQLIRQSLEQDQLTILREQEILARRLNISNDIDVERSDAFYPTHGRVGAQPFDRLDSSLTSAESVVQGGERNGADSRTLTSGGKVAASTGDGEIDLLISELRKSDESGRLYEYEKVDEKIDACNMQMNANPADPMPTTTVFNVHNESSDLNRSNQQFHDQISKDSGLESNQPSHEKINRHPFFERKHYSMELSDDEDRILCRRIDMLENTLGDVKREAEKYQHLLIDSQSHYIELERRYDSARKRIKDYQDRERTLVEREEAHLNELREKDAQYTVLFRQLNEKVLLLENQLSEAQKKRSSLIETNGSVRGSLTDRSFAVLDGGTVSASSNRTVNVKLTDNSPALAYLPSKKLTEIVKESTWPKKSQSESKIRSVSFDTQVPSTSAFPDEVLQYVDEIGYCNFNRYDFGVPETVLLDSKAARSKVEAVKQSTTMSARSLPSRHADAEVFVMCHHTVEHAEVLKRHPTHVITGVCTCPSVDSSIQSISLATPTSENSQPTKSAACAISNHRSKLFDSTAKTCPSSHHHHANGCNHVTSSSPLVARKLLDLLKLGKKSQTSSNKDLEQTMLGIDVGPDKLTEVLHWNCDEVSNFIKTIGMNKYVQDFMRNRIDGCKLLQVDGAKLKSMGISDSNDRALIKKRVKQMKLVLEKERKKETKKLLNISLPEKDRRPVKH